MNFTSRIAGRISIAAVALLLGTPESALAQGGRLTEEFLTQPQWNVGLVDVRPDGTPSGGVYDTTSQAGESISGLVYVAPCGGLGSGSETTIRLSATDVWRLSGRLLAISAEQATAEVIVQRLRVDGKDVTVPPQSTTLTLDRRGRMTLDRITVPARGTCEARTVSLDAVFASRLDLNPALAAARARAVAGGGVGSVSASSTGGVTRAGGGGGGGVANVEGVIVPSTRVGVGAGAGGAVPRVLAADLWLVRSATGQADETSHTTAQVFLVPRSFVFAPIAVHSRAGVLTVTVQGTVETGQAPDGEWRLFFSANRTVTFVPAVGQPRDTAPIVEGSTKTSVPMPGPDDVLSFEMPPLRVPGGAALADKLSIRLRMVAP